MRSLSVIMMDAFPFKTEGGQIAGEGRRDAIEFGGREPKAAPKARRPGGAFENKNVFGARPEDMDKRRPMVVWINHHPEAIIRRTVGIPKTNINPSASEGCFDP